MNKKYKNFALVLSLLCSACAHEKQNTETVSPDEAAKLDRKLVKESVVFEQGTKEGAIVPDISSPRLRAKMVPEHIENGKLIECHREWELEGDVSILGIPKKGGPK